LTSGHSDADAQKIKFYVRNFQQRYNQKDAQETLIGNVGIG